MIFSRYSMGVKPVFVFGSPAGESLKVAFRAFKGAKYAKANSYDYLVKCKNCLIT